MGSPSPRVFLTPVIWMGPLCFYNCLGSHLNKAEEALLLFSETKQAEFIQIEIKWNRNEMKKNKKKRRTRRKEKEEEEEEEEEEEVEEEEEEEDDDDDEKDSSVCVDPFTKT